jgi:hypothetical protein
VTSHKTPLPSSGSHGAERSAAIDRLTPEAARDIVERTTPRAGLVLPRPVDAGASSDPRPAPPTDDVGVTPSARSNDPYYLRALTSPDQPISGEGDYRPGWVRAGLPREEWERARRANDAAVARERPGSPEFARLMEVRVRLHLPAIEGLSLGDIDAYKAAQLRPVVSASTPRSTAQRLALRVILAAGILAMLGLVSYLAGLLLFGSPASTSPPQRALGAGQTPTNNATTTTSTTETATVRSEPTAADPARSDAVEPRATEATAAQPEPSSARPRRMPATSTPVVPAPPAKDDASDGLYFRSPK